MMETIEGTVVKTRFRSADSGWTVMEANVSSERNPVVVVGLLAAEVEPGVNFTARGQWAHNPKFGRQFKLDALTVLPPTTAEQVIARLKTYPGIGAKMAKLIVAEFGDATWEVMDERIEALTRVRGLGGKALRKIKAHHDLQHGPIAQVQNRLIELGAPARMAHAIHKAFGEDALEVLEQHPYRIAAKVERFGFKLAEKIARFAGLDPESDERVAAGIMHTLKERHAWGHCAMPPEDLTDAAVRLLGLRRDIVEAGVERLTKAGELRYQPGLLFSRRMDYTEDQVAHAVGMLSTSIHAVWDVGELPAHLSPGQREAVEAVARSGLTIITGGPGTGKSTVLASVLKVAERQGIKIMLCAPTGRAAKRMTEATGHPASTVHRLLGTVPGTMAFRHDKGNPLPAGLLVIDEASMLDVRLADSLLCALTREHRVLVVGDADQLPSVGPGNVLRDLIEAAEREGAMIPVVRLTQVFRQAAGSTIVSNAHRMLAGADLEPDPPSRGAAGEFYVLAASTPAEAHAKIIRMASERVPEAYGLERTTEVQVLCPMHKGQAGTGAFNASLQQLYTADGEGFGRTHGPRFFLGDRVMQTRNDYERNVFNGDIGTVVGFETGADGPEMVVDFDGTVARYGMPDLGPLRLAYAMSIHKSQGSEFPAVLIPVLMSHRIMLRRNLLYTAITRAKRLCVIVGDPRAIRMAIENADAEKRWTGLTRRLLAALGRSEGMPSAANG